MGSKKPKRVKAEVVKAELMRSPVAPKPSAHDALLVPGARKTHEFQKIKGWDKFLPVAVNPDNDKLNQDQLREMSGCSKSSISKLQNDPEFQDFLRVERLKHISNNLMAVDAALVETACNTEVPHQVPAAKLLYERFDKNYDPKKAIDVNVKHTIFGVFRDVMLNDDNGSE